MIKLNEDSRNTLVAKSKRGQREKDGKTRYEKRLKSRIASSNREYNSINMDKLFRQEILDVNIKVHGETDDYIVTFSFGGFLDELKSQLERAPKLDLRLVVRALVNAFNREDVYVKCSCDDFFYRFGYWLSRDNIIFGEKQTIPSDKTNPNNDLGAGCKHILLALANTSWAIKVASVITNYINYMEKNRQELYAKIIYPAIYDKPYEEPVQTDIFSKDELETDTDTLDRANIEARKKGQFQKGNQYRFQPKDTLKGQEEIDFDDNVEEE